MPETVKLAALVFIALMIAMIILYHSYLDRQPVRRWRRRAPAPRL
ncbi:MAG: hypothetical protein ACREJG_06145 [Candidatus Rokuibacteriota bacterium]